MRILEWNNIDLNSDKILLKKTQRDVFPTNNWNGLRFAKEVVNIIIILLYWAQRFQESE